MSDKEQETTAPETQNAAAANTVVAASNQAAVNNENQINVTVVVPRPAAAPRGAGASPRRSAGGNSGHSAPSRSPAPAERLNPQMTAPTSTRGQQPTSAGITQSYDSEGNLRRTIRDGLDGSVTLTTDDGVTRVIYSDRNGFLRTQSDQGGFRENTFERYTEAGEPRTRSRTNSAAEGIDGVYGLRPDVTCGGRGSVAATNAVVDSVTRNEIQEFLNRHPSIKETLRGMNIPIVELNGQPATTASVLSQPSNFHACPVGRPNLTVERVR